MLEPTFTADKSIAELVRLIPEGLLPRITKNFKGEESGVLGLDPKTYKVRIGYCFIDHALYNVIPLDGHVGRKYWSIDTLVHKLTVMNGRTFQSTEDAIAEAQIQYSTGI